MYRVSHKKQVKSGIPFTYLCLIMLIQMVWPFFVSKTKRFST